MAKRVFFFQFLMIGVVFGMQEQLAQKNFIGLFKPKPFPVLGVNKSIFRNTDKLNLAALSHDGSTFDEKFKQIISRHQMPILALVKQDGKSFYFLADWLNSKIFNNSLYPLDTRELLAARVKGNPLNNKKNISAPIEYYLYEQKDLNHPRFIFLCSDADFVSTSVEPERQQFLKKLFIYNLKDIFLAEYAYDLGRRFYFGEGVLANYETAKNLFDVVFCASDASLQLKANSASFLAEIYFNGIGVQIDHSLAKKLFEYVYSNSLNRMMKLRAADGLGQAFYWGLGVKQDFVKARVFFEQVIADKDLDPSFKSVAFACLGELFYLGRRGVEADCVKAVDFLEKAFLNPTSNLININNAIMVYLAEIYLFGLGGVEKKSKEALNLLEKVYSNLDVGASVRVRAMRNLVDIYGLGNGFEKNIARSCSLLKEIFYMENIDSDIKAKAGFLLANNIYYDIEKDCKKTFNFCFKAYNIAKSLPLKKRIVSLLIKLDESVIHEHKITNKFKKVLESAVDLYDDEFEQKCRKVLLRIESDYPPVKRAKKNN